MEVLALVAVTVIAPSLLPLAGETVTQSALSLTVHEVFELIVKELLLPDELPKERLVVETDSKYDGFCPA